MRVTIFSTKSFEEKIFSRFYSIKHELHFVSDRLNMNNAAFAKESDAVCIFTNDDASGKVLEKLKAAGVNYLTLRSAGYDHVDLKTAEKLNIKVSNVPEYSPYAIAEHAITLILAMNRKIIQARNKILDNDFRIDDLIGFNMNGKSIGIIGTGRIGGAVAKILNGFGCNLIAYDIYPDTDLSEKFGIVYTDLETLCKESDIITLHCPLEESTKHLINKSNIRVMKDGVMIVNTSRGGVLNTTDAIDGLKSGKIGYLGLDVYENEKGLFFYNHSDEILQDDVFARLLTFKNVLITGHYAFLTETALNNIAETTLANLDKWEAGIRYENELW